MNSSFDRASDGKEEWLTPPELVEKLGRFDLDPCSPATEFRPYDNADRSYSLEDDGDGLAKAWHGRVFCNPPYGNKTGEWLAKCASHGNAIALVFARTETEAFQEHVFGKADALLFIAGRINFHEFACAHCGFGMSHHKEKRPKGSKCVCVDWKKARAAVRGGAAGAPSVLIAYGWNNVQAI